MASPGSNSSSSLTNMDPTIPGFETPTKNPTQKENSNSSGEKETSVFRSLASPYSHQLEATTPSPPNVAFDIPQWKKDLIQRRKTNIAKKIPAGICFKEDSIAFVTSADTSSTLSPTCDSKNTLILTNNNNSDTLILPASSINTNNDTNKSNTSQNVINSSATTSINSMLKMPATLHQPKGKIEFLCGGHYTQVNNKSPGGSLHNYTEKLPTRSASVLQSEKQQLPVPVPQSVVVGSTEQNSNDDSSPTLPQENVKFRKNLTEQRGSTNTTSSDSLLTSTSRLSSSLKAAAEAEFYKKNNNDNNSGAVCVSDEQQNSPIYQQKPALTTKSISKGNNNDNGDGEHDEEDDECQLHHQLISGRESDSLACAVNLNEVDVKNIEANLFFTEHNNKTNGNNLIPSLKLAVVINKKPCGIPTASVRSSSVSASPQFIKNQNIGNANVVSTHHNYKINTKVRSNHNSSLTPSVAKTATTNNESSTRVTNNKKKMVAVQDMNEITSKELDFDPSEELQYGPGIVSKLRCRYLSLALRQSMGKQRLSLDSLRRATSLNNLLDSNGIHEEDDDEDDTPDNTNKETTSPLVTSTQVRTKGTSNSIKVNETVIGYNRNTKADPSQTTTCPTGLSYHNQHRSRHIKRGNDSLKRARSVEALLCEKSPWNFSNSQLTMVTNGATDQVTIEEKISNARERLLSGTESNPPKRLTSIIDDTERPPPDLVKQTLKIFEASANRRVRAVNRNSGGEVATKVANYKSIITQNKPAITFPKPPASPKKSNQKLKSLSTELKNNILSTSTSPTFVSSVEQVDNIVSPLSLTPTTSSRSITAKPIRSKMESTPIRSVGCVSGVLETLSDSSPDIIPRHNLFDKTVMPVDSPVTELTKSIEKLRIESPTRIIQPNRQQSATLKDHHSKFSSESSERESENDDDSMDGEYVVNIEESNSTKHISKSALENIAKAGTSHQFLFPRNNSASFSNGNFTASVPLHDIPTLTTPGSTTTTVKQIGVIRPLLAEPPQQQIKKNCIEEMPNNHALTNREIEKNRINNEKKVEISGSNNSLEKIGGLVVTSKLKKIDVAQSEDDKSCQASKSSAVISKKKRTAVGTFPENNTMVFNFKDRKEVPDYIENDGLIFKHKRELPKPNESGFVLLGDLSLETSTDPDDEWPMCPPSPCDVEFENAHIIIDGKSNIKSRTKEANFRVQFNDTLTSTFEYPSESSVIEESGSEYADLSSLDELDAPSSPYGASANEYHEEMESPIVHHHVKSEEIIQLPTNNKVLGNLSLGSAPLGSYTPINAKTENIFQLGVTRAPNSRLDGTDDDAHSNEKLPADYYGELDKPSLEYLKPASDDLTIAYSEGSLKTDLLY